MLLPAPLGALLGLAALVTVGFWFKVATSAKVGNERELFRNLSLAATGMGIFLAIIAFGFLAHALADLLW